MNEQDRRAIENMCLTGMEPDALYACFPKFAKEEIEKIYSEIRNGSESAVEENVISINCS